MSYQSGQPRVNAEGHLVREITVASRFSSRRFLLVAILASVLIVTNPANELRHKMEDAVDKVLNRKNTTRQRDHSEWTWNKMLDPPVSVTNFGLFSVEERTTKIEFLGLTQKWSCPYYNGQMGSFCSALGMWGVLLLCCCETCRRLYLISSLAIELQQLETFAIRGHCFTIPRNMPTQHTG